tara:strand:- start:47 stop:805 length:759 start_codon:yes stop_codon:yes gene_type:complete
MKKILLLLCVPLISISQNIGDFYQGGIVFHLDSFGKGLIIDTSYIQSTYPWSTQDDLVSDWGPNLHFCAGTEDTSIGGGWINTTSFINDHPNQFYAANICYNSTSGGYSDWFLPSKDELWRAMLRINVIDSSINIFGGDTIFPNFHWSSTQTPAKDIRYAYGVWPHSSVNGIPNGPVQLTNSKNMPYLVRAIRCIDGDCNFSGTTTVQEYNINRRNVLKIVDLLGRDSERKRNTPIFYIYNDGTVEKKIILE